MFHFLQVSGFSKLSPVLYRLLTRDVVGLVSHFVVPVGFQFTLDTNFGTFYCSVVLNKARKFSTTRLFSDRLFSTNQLFLIVRLNFFSQSIPSSRLMSFRLVISICIFCLLFWCSISAGIFYLEFHFIFVHVLISVFHFRYISFL